MDRVEIKRKLEELGIVFSNKDNTERLRRKLERSWVTKGVKAFRFVEGRLCTGGVGGSKETFFEEGEVYEVEGEIGLCENGYHFYKENNGCFGVDLFGPNTVFHEIEAYGEVISDTHKCVCRKIKVGKRVELELDNNNNSGRYNSGRYNSGRYNSGRYNSGSDNSGRYNSGNYNSGHSNSGWNNSGSYNSGSDNSGSRNSGSYNSGSRNSGNYNSGSDNSGSRNSGSDNSGSRNSGWHNSGSRNSGNYNSGDSNSGWHNSGSRNSGWHNSGNRNSGRWNSCNDESGHLNDVQSDYVRVFNRTCKREDWESAELPNFFYWIPQDGESYKDSWRRSWTEASETDRKKIINLPNFDWGVFTNITGIEKPKDYPDTDPKINLRKEEQYLLQRLNEVRKSLEE